ncbi:MAG: DNA topoisomerase, partial [Thermoproteota archaeon]|nr:DNA topoisomerase [Thermoproteota archaeon]
MRKKNQISVVKLEKRNVTKSTKKIIDNFKIEIDQYYDENGFVSFSAKNKKYTILGTNSPKEG